MKNSTKNFKVLILVLGMFAFAGCGSSSSGPTPLQVFANGSNGEPQLNSILASGTFNTTSFSGFTATNPYWLFTGGFSTSGGNYLAPADGIVSNITTVTLNGVSENAVTILHSGNLATQVIGIQVVNVREHDPVLQGSSIGLYLTTGQVAFQVLYDGTPVCPLSYVSTSFRASLTSSFASEYSQLCQ